MVNVNSSTIQIQSTTSDDNSCRFLYSKKWHSNRPIALFILMNPSKGTEYKIDNTIVNINNFCIDNGFGEFRLVNLFPYMATDSKELNGKHEVGSKENLEIISSNIDECDKIYIAWGTEKKYIRKKRELEKLLVSKVQSSNDLLCWFDNKDGSYPKHLRIISK